MFGMLGIFSEFEREMIVARVNAGLARAKEAIARNGEFRSKAGKIRNEVAIT
jgi:DNA invertase Pin-like site-specific DNA recombinase